MHMQSVSCKNFQHNIDILFDILLSVLQLCFGKKYLKDCSYLKLKFCYQKQNKTQQEMTTDIKAALSLGLLFNCLADVDENLLLQVFIDRVLDCEIQKALRMADIKDLKSALVYVQKFGSGHLQR